MNIERSLAPVDPHNIQYLDRDNVDNLRYDIILVGLHSVWNSQMAIRHAELMLDRFMNTLESH